MRHLLTAVATAAALALIAVSATLNYLFMASLARTPGEAAMMGTAAVAGDVIKACLPYFMVLAIRARRMLFVLLAVPTFAFLTLVSLIAALGFAADMRGGTAHGRDAANRQLAAHEARLADLDRQKAAVGPARPLGQIDAEIAQARLDRRWAATKECADVTLPASKTFCLDVHRLSGERAMAASAAALDAEQRTLSAAIAQLRAGGAGQEAEPQVKVLAVLSGQDMSVVRTIVSLCGALFIEIGSSLGLYLAIHHGGTRPPQPPSPLPLARQSAAPIDNHVERFALACLVARRGGVVTTGDLAAAYVAWCAQDACTATATFDAEFMALAKDVGIGRTRAGYVGVALRTPARSITQISARPMLGAP